MLKKILVAVDLSREENAINLSRIANKLAIQNSAEVRLIYVVPNYRMPMLSSYFPENFQETLVAEMGETLEKFAQEQFSVTLSVKLLEGKRARNILLEVKNWHPDLVVIGCRKKASRENHRVFGSCSSSVADRADCSVLVIR